MGSKKINSALLRIAHDFLSSYGQLSAPALLAHLLPDFTHKVLPSSLQFPSRGDRNEFERHAAQITAIFCSFEMVPVCVFEDREKGAVVAHVKMIGELIEGMGGGKWENEAAVLLKISEEEGKVGEMTEFLDSWKARVLQEKLMGGRKGEVLK